MKTLLLTLSGICAATLLLANTFAVTNTNDSGTGSLRAAIGNANAYPGAHSIVFNIPLADPGYVATQGVWKINLTSTLPILNHSNVTIDGTTQAVYAGDTNPYGPEIMLDGGNSPWADFAFHLYNCSGCTVKGLIIGGFVVGIQISGASAQNNFILANYIGCNYNATDTLGNTHGIYILSGPHHNYIGGGPAERNIISGNNHTGMRIVNSNYNVVQGNYVGLNRTGNAALRNYDGISVEGTSKYNLIGGYTADERNYVSGNVAYGIPVFGIGCNYNIIAGNYVGTDITGTQAIPNTYGVLFDDGASYNLLGGRQPGAGNLLSGNSGYGLFIYNFGTMNDTIIGNLIGTDYSGTIALPNANGIVIDGPSFYHTIDSNLISGNSQNGISIHIAGSDSNIVINNKIGTDITGLFPVPNQFDGIRIGEGPKKNLIGLPGQGNIIAYNGGNGISVMTAAEQFNTFCENSIFNNAGLGIDLFPIGVTPNDAGDADTGPNDLMNFPVITDAFEAAVTHIIGHVDCPASSAITVEIFICDINAPGNGQGKTFVGRTTCDANGDFELSTGNAVTMDCITATATDNLGNTSEFSENVLVGFVSAPVYANSKNLQVYPTLASNFIVLRNVLAGSAYEITDISGRVVDYGIYDEQRIIISGLKNGLYAIRIHTPKGVVTRKFVKE